MSQERAHKERVYALQKQLKSVLSRNNDSEHSSCVALRYEKENSNTTRSKHYKKQLSSIDCSAFNNILRVDIEKQIVVAEPRVTMEELVKATLLYGFVVPVVSEFKTITVGGAIMGCGAESSSHRWGIFHDTCLSFEILCGSGDIIRASPFENADIFYGISGSYGSLGILLSAEIRLIPASEHVRVHYTVFTQAEQALSFIKKRIHAEDSPDFLDGIFFSQTTSVVMQGFFQTKQEREKRLPVFSMKNLSSEWYYQHVRRKALTVDYFEENMTLQEYLFRYDTGAFWMGAYLFQRPFIRRFLFEVLLKLSNSSVLALSPEEYRNMHKMTGLNWLLRTLGRPWMKSEVLWKVLHTSEKWVHERLMVQDFCVPETCAQYFLEDVFKEIDIFPLWICPIKGTKEKQLFAPHRLLEQSEITHFINVGVYGLPSPSHDVAFLTSLLETRTELYGGRKVLYGRSYYSLNDFWNIYSKNEYEILREKMHAQDVFTCISDKVLSE